LGVSSAWVGGAIEPFEGEPRFISAKSAGLCCEAEIRERTGMSGGDIFKDKRADRSVGDELRTSFAATMSFTQ
jgi:hypothetical protein